MPKHSDWPTDRRTSGIKPLALLGAFELTLTATDSDGATGTATVLLDPKTVQITLASNPTGLRLALNAASATAPFTMTVIEGSSNSISAPSQTLAGTDYVFVSWSDGGAQSHNIAADATATYTASFNAVPSAPTNTSLPTISGSPRVGRTLTASTGSWSGTTPMTFGFQWRRCDRAGANCADIVGATSTTYTPTSSDVGFRIRAVVTAANSVGSSSATSAPTASIKA